MQLSHGVAPLVLGIMLFPTWAAAQRGAVDSRVFVYADQNDTTIVTSAVSASGVVDERVEIGARYLVDIVSSASVDVVTQATDAMSDVRHEVGASLIYRGDPDQRLGASYARSVEHDYESHNVSAFYARDLRERMLTLSVWLGHQRSEITVSGAYAFERSLFAYLGSVGLDWVLGHKDRLELVLSGSLYDGFQASPYRYLTIGGLAYAENHPETRGRGALTLRHRHAFERNITLRTEARFYRDSYGVTAGNAEVGFVQERGLFDVGASLRIYGQSAARFFEARYARQQRYLTLDKELTRFMNAFATLMVGVRPRVGEQVESLRVDLRASFFGFRYGDYPFLRRRLGVTAQLGATVGF